MEHTDVFKQILEAEQKAKSQREEAVRRQAGLDKYLADNEAELRKETYAKIDAEIAEEEKRYQAAVDSDIEKLTKKQEQDISDIHSSFNKKLDGWVDKLFDIVVGNV